MWAEVEEGAAAPDSPGLLDFALRTLTVVVSDVAQRAVDGGEVRFAHVQEVGAHAAHRHFGDVGEGLADGTAEDEHAHLLVEGGDVGVPHEGLGSFVQEVDPVALPNNDLEGHGGGRRSVSGRLVTADDLQRVEWECGADVPVCGR